MTTQSTKHLEWLKQVFSTKSLSIKARVLLILLDSGVAIGLTKKSQWQFYFKTLEEELVQMSSLEPILDELREHGLFYMDEDGVPQSKFRLVSGLRDKNPVRYLLAHFYSEYERLVQAPYVKGKNEYVLMHRLFRRLRRIDIIEERITTLIMAAIGSGRPITVSSFVVDNNNFSI